MPGVEILQSGEEPKEDVEGGGCSYETKHTQKMNLVYVSCRYMTLTTLSSLRYWVLIYSGCASAWEARRRPSAVREGRQREALEALV